MDEYQLLVTPTRSDEISPVLVISEIVGSGKIIHRIPVDQDASKAIEKLLSQNPFSKKSKDCNQLFFTGWSRDFDETHLYINFIYINQKSRSHAKVEVSKVVFESLQAFFNDFCKRN